MKPLTKYLHKAMIPFHGIPFLAYSFAAIPENSQVVVIVNHFSEQIINYFGNSYGGRSIMYLMQTNPKGTGDALVQFSEEYRPQQPVIVWQADQMIFHEEVRILSQSDPDAAIYSRTSGGLIDIGFWKVKPSTLTQLKGHFDGREYRALPVLERNGLKRIEVQRDKLEVSFSSWEKIDLQCKMLKQAFSTEYR